MEALVRTLYDCGCGILRNREAVMMINDSIIVDDDVICLSLFKKHLLFHCTLIHVDWSGIS